MTCDSCHNFAAIQGIECVINCLDFCTLWEGVCTNLFSISDCVFRSYFVRIKNNLDDSPTFSVDEIPGVSPLLSCRFNTLAHDHGVHDFFIKYFTNKQFIQLIQVKIKICWRHIISNFMPCSFLREDFTHVVFPLSSIFWTWIIVKGDHSLVVRPYIHLYIVINSNLKGGVGI